MKNTSHNISEVEAKQIINEIDFTRIMTKMRMSTGRTKRQILKSVELYRHFLFLKFKYGQAYKLPPSEEIDNVWHYHILGTHQYHDDCKALFGGYLHHYPYFSIDEHSDINDLNVAFEETQRLHFDEFGDYIYKLRFEPFSGLVKRIKKVWLVLKDAVSDWVAPLPENKH